MFAKFASLAFLANALLVAAVPSADMFAGLMNVEAGHGEIIPLANKIMSIMGPGNMNRLLQSVDFDRLKGVMDTKLAGGDVTEQDLLNCGCPQDLMEGLGGCQQDVENLLDTCPQSELDAAMDDLAQECPGGNCPDQAPGAGGPAAGAGAGAGAGDTDCPFDDEDGAPGAGAPGGPGNINGGGPATGADDTDCPFDDEDGAGAPGTGAPGAGGPGNINGGAPAAGEDTDCPFDDEDGAGAPGTGAPGAGGPGNINGGGPAAGGAADGAPDGDDTPCPFD